MASYTEPLQHSGDVIPRFCPRPASCERRPHRCSDERADEVDPEIRPAAAREQGRPESGAETDGWIEGTSRDRAPGEYGGNDGEADRQAVERIALGCLGRRYVEHDQDQCGGENDLDCKCLQDLDLRARV